MTTTLQPVQPAIAAQAVAVTDADVHAARQILGYKSGQVRKILEAFAVSKANQTACPAAPVAQPVQPKEPS